MMLVFATFYAVAIKYYKEWTGFLFEKVGTISQAVGGYDFSNLSPLYIGLDLAVKILDKISAWSPIDSLGYVIAGGVILICFALLTARMVVILCESYIAIGAAILLLGFGGSAMLKDYAINTMRYAVSVVFKLFAMQLIMGVGIDFINKFASTTNLEYTDIFVMLAIAVVLLVLVNTLPETVAGIISGSHTGSGVGLGSAAKGVAMGGVAGAAAVAGGAIGAAKAYNTVSRAVKLASMDGHQGVGGIAKGAAGHLKNSFHAARQEGATSAGGSTLARMHSNVKDMHQAQKAMTDPNHQANRYRANRFAGSNSSDSKPASDSTDNKEGG
jgi:type IV secretion system protein TrbL